MTLFVGRCITHLKMIVRQGRVSGLGVEDWAHPDLILNGAVHASPIDRYHLVERGSCWIEEGGAQQ
jgi:hypothetical protein